MTKLTSINAVKAWAKAEEQRLEMRLKGPGSSNEWISLSGSLLTILKLRQELGD